MEIQGGGTGAKKEKSLVTSHTKSLINEYSVSNASELNVGKTSYQQYQLDLMRDRAFYHPKKWYQYGIREKHDRKILGIIPQKGSDTLEQEKADASLAESEVQEKRIYYKIDTNKFYEEP